MSKDTRPHILKPAEVSKKIIEKPHKQTSTTEWLDYSGNPKNEQLAEYVKKKTQFLAAAASYNRMNNETVMCRKVALHDNYERMLNLDFLKEKEREEEECIQLCCCPKCAPNKTGQLLRKRSLRQMASVKKPVEDPKPSVCSIEPYFKRYLTLNKFIWAARTVIIQNRLLKVLEKLKKLTFKDIRAIENADIEKRCEDYHCHPVFLKFL